MKLYRCDQCGAETCEIEVTVEGVPNPHGDILMPAPFHIKHFCNQECFFAFYLPKPKDGE